MVAWLVWPCVSGEAAHLLPEKADGSGAVWYANRETRKEGVRSVLSGFCLAS